MNKILFIVDPQLDFITGTLQVQNAGIAMSHLAEYILNNKDHFSDIIVTLDFHPWKHCSFKSQGGIWPPHCIGGTSGAAIWPDLQNALACTSANIHVELKGRNPEKEEYSIFRNDSACGRLKKILNKADEIEICGIAGDVCVLNTLKDGMVMTGNKFSVLTQFSPSLDNGIALQDFIRNM